MAQQLIVIARELPISLHDKWLVEGNKCLLPNVDLIIMFTSVNI